MARQPTPEQKAQIWLAATLEEQRRVAGAPIYPQQRGKAVAEATPRPEGRLTQALANAVAVGPGRATRDERRLMLARLLAQRVIREDDRSGQWTRLSKQLVKEIEQLEQQGQDARAQVERQPFAPDQTVLVRAQKELGMQAVEEFLYALNRAVSALAIQDSAPSRPTDRTIQTEEEDQGDDNDN